MNLVNKLWWLGLVAIACCVSLLAVEAQPDAEGLAGRVNALEKRVAELEKRQATTVMLPAAQAPKQIPPGWSPRNINGMTYYVVPLDHNADQKAKPAH